MLRRLVVHPVTPEADLAGDEARRAKRDVPKGDEARAVGGSAGLRRAAGQEGPDRRPLAASRIPFGRVERGGHQRGVGDRRLAGEVPADVERRAAIDEPLSLEEWEGGWGLRGRIVMSDDPVWEIVLPD